MSRHPVLCSCDDCAAGLNDEIEPAKEQSAEIRQWVVCAAIRNKAGKIIAGARHYDEVMRGNFIINGERPQEWWDCEQGFIDQFCKFLTREEAWVIAERNGQIRRRCGGDNGVLYSENLY